MTDSEKTAWTIKILRKAVQSHVDRLERGARLRDEMHNKLERGEQVDNYRLKWLQDSAMRVIELLSTLAEEFNRLHPEDRCSTNDLKDVLATALNAINDITKDRQ